MKEVDEVDYERAYNQPCDRCRSLSIYHADVHVKPARSAIVLISRLRDLHRSCHHVRHVRHEYPVRLGPEPAREADRSDGRCSRMTEVRLVARG